MIRKLKELGKKHKLSFFLITIVFLFTNFNIVEKHNIENGLMNILIKDFFKNYKSVINKHKYFFIRGYKLNENELSVYRIGPEHNKIVLSPDGDGYYPKDYIIFKNKIFFIDGEITNNPSKKVFVFLKEHNLIDSTLYKVDQGLIKFEDLNDRDGKIRTSDRDKLATYVVCNNKIIGKSWSNKGKGVSKMIDKAIRKGCN